MTNEQREAQQKRVETHIRQTVQIGRGINAQSEREQEANKRPAPANNREQDR